MFKQYTLPYKVTHSSSVLSLNKSVAPYVLCPGRLPSMDAFEIPAQEFEHCLISEPFPLLGTVLADFVVLDEDDYPLVAFPSIIPDETQVHNYVLTIIFYLLCIFILLAKHILCRRYKCLRGSLGKKLIDLMRRGRLRKRHVRDSSTS